MLDIARERTFAPGEKVIEQGRAASTCGSCSRGSCDVVRAATHNGAVVLAELAVQLVWRDVVFQPAPHSASVVAKTPVKLLSISRSDYDDLIRDGVPAAYKLAYNIVEAWRAKLRTMDERVAELASDHAEHEQKQANGQPAEWNRFKEKLFGAWN